MFTNSKKEKVGNAKETIEVEVEVEAEAEVEVEVEVEVKENNNNNNNNNNNHRDNDNDNDNNGGWNKTQILEENVEPRRLAILPPSYKDQLSLTLSQKPPLRPSHLILDALPYIEPFHSLEVRSRAERIVLDEMQRMEAEHKLEQNWKDKYLESFPLPKAPYIYSAELDEQVERIQSKEKILDEERYECRGPRVEQLKSLSAWIQSIENVRAQLSHVFNQHMNVELYKQYLPEQWKKHTMELKAQEQYYQKLLLEKESQMAEINKQRKKLQMECELELNQSQRQWWDLVDKNNRIELQCYLMQQQIEQLSSRR